MSGGGGSPSPMRAGISLSVVFLSIVGVHVAETFTSPAQAIQPERVTQAVHVGEPTTLDADVARIATIAEDRFPDEFAYAGMADDSKSGYLVFRGAVPSEIRREIPDGVSIALIADAGFTMRELSSYAADLSRSADTPISGAVSVLVNPKPADRRFIVSIGRAELEQDSTRKGVGDEQDIDQIAEEIRDFVDEVPPPSSFAVEVEADLQDVSQPEAEGGGRVLAGSCTGAFPVKRNQGPELGILTAGHCPGTGSYGGTSNMFYPVFPYSLSTTSNASTGGDFRWNHSRYMLDGFTYLGEGGNRRSTSAVNSVYGGAVCGYGKTTGHKCGSVWSVGSQATIYVPDGNANYTVGPLTCTVSHVTQPGDSGGPWYIQYNSVATGIHSGHYNASSCWSSAPNALRAFDMSLWTG